MKNTIIKFCCLFTLIFSVIGCGEEAEFQASDIELVPIYYVTDIVGSEAPHSIEVYKEKPLLIEFSSKVQAKSFAISNYQDLSDGTAFNITFDKVVLMEQEDGSFIDVVNSYVINADVLTGDGSIEITWQNSDNTFTTETYTIKLVETERYN
ncbi:hypothetical protein A8C32_16940 [Flavivirga aquatica]|uniref:Uncharacterized protein n=1 Tax=Flavivirga aquatica TaxID=1849968 RepID=A0A1E5T8F0_9FLAO|nr:hypothetical protein [Flavivirga aquatica]OEK07665.1 hypothetical protein A8C32_16940 [Flavivirga aquatica]